MKTRRQKAMREFRRTMKWIVVLAVVAVVGALVFAASQTELTIHIVAATAFGVFFSVVLGLGLVALAFFSGESRRDGVETDAPKPNDGNNEP